MPLFRFDFSIIFYLITPFSPRHDTPLRRAIIYCATLRQRHAADCFRHYCFSYAISMPMLFDDYAASYGAMPLMLMLFAFISADTICHVTRQPWR